MAVVVVSSKMRSFGFDFVEIFVSKVRKYQRHSRVQTNDIGIFKKMSQVARTTFVFPLHTKTTAYDLMNDCKLEALS